MVGYTASYFALLPLEIEQADMLFLSRLLHIREPELSDHLDDLQCSLSLLMTPMLMCMFIEVTPQRLTSDHSVPTWQ